MFFAKKRPEGEPLSRIELVEKIDQFQALDQALRGAVRSLLVLLKRFSLDLEELQTREFRQDVDEFSEQIIELKKAQTLEKALKKRLLRFQDFVDQQSTYLTERDTELRNVVTLLSNAMGLLNRENAAYHQQILDQSHNFERIIGLDDLRKIKSSLTQEVRNLTTMVENKRRAEQQQLSSLSGQVKELREELKKSHDENRRDALTGIFNRRALDEFLQALVDQNQIRRQKFSVVMLDIDNFKSVNDCHGHLIGDQVLQALASACLDVLRSEDFVCRFGGEEFVAVMPGASRRAAERRAGHLCRAVAGTRFALPVEDRQDHLELTVSIGVTEYRAGDTSKTLLERADQALYQAKQGGKNRVSTI